MPIAGAQDNLFCPGSLTHHLLNFFLRGVFGGHQAAGTKMLRHKFREGGLFSILIGCTGHPIVGTAAEEGMFVRPEGIAPHLGHSLTAHIPGSLTVTLQIAQRCVRGCE